MACVIDLAAIRPELSKNLFPSKRGVRGAERAPRLKTKKWRYPSAPRGSYLAIPPLSTCLVHTAPPDRLKADNEPQTGPRLNRHSDYPCRQGGEM